MNQRQRESEWRQICDEFRDSGMTRKAFCQSRGIALSTLGYWLKRLSVATTSGPSTTGFVSLGTMELSRPTVLRIHLGGEVVAELDLPADETVIRNVLRAAASR
ncbi:MAG: hypothetical protein EA382_13765 [Spirochaetaceae bacterium]|nr:MAG: hypothetical protein EA382_13765 [Spirochaetaceae bacterium]